ncbi:hypothetical protein ACT4ML_08710 [Natrinema sp. LN54]|uniref:hypothetical protein n=1 Tax=Natrinema sp. LN54 TaxID=3458705 RepID=UPI004035632A
MSIPTDDQEPPDRLVEILNDVDALTLRAVRTYVEQRLDDLRPSLQEEIRSEAKGEIIDIEDYGAYALVRKYPPARGRSKKSSQPLSIYRVRREKRLDGGETLHWRFLGDVTERSDGECRNCGEGTSDDSEGV